ncbi:hypothetical protein [Kordiimonas laminariae]|uniref:hypothetical protein n=1 Tax=Kordiimonas laminariae TaxID=2917717 RepID=UPI001FF2DAF8|nr:hypothetical protein [Kordiimonas laminariae]MCK0069557.1 hypothetical protein [Kordiimonas laminariae]
METLLQTLNSEHPILLLDADEVLLKFVETLEGHMLNHGFELRLTSFQISGNVYHKATNKLADPLQVKKLIGSFFDECVDHVPVVDGAVDAIAELSEHFQVAVLTNVPSHCRERRENSLREQGIHCPVISNKGDKGAAVKRFTDFTSGRTVFVDDLPPQHASVAELSPDTHRVHFVADKRLRAMIPQTEYSHARIDTWPELTHYLKDLLKA